MMTKGNLLLIDDETVLLECLKDVLEDTADEIFLATNGEEGYNAFRDHSIQCIVCDINMPVMNGVELIQRLRAENVDVPFIFYTGHGNRQLMLEAARYGAFDFLDKPYLTGLEDVVRRALAISTNAPRVETEDEFTSEFRRLLEELDK